MAQADKLIYFNVRARGEAIRMMYSVSGTTLNDERISFEDWPTRKAETPMGQIPILVTEEGELNQSNSIARYVAKKLGMFGNGLWEETLNDMIIENVMEAANLIPKIYGWLLFKRSPEPEDGGQKMKEEAKTKWIQCLDYIQKISEKRGTKFTVSDKIGAADIWLYTALEFSKVALPDIMTLTSWTKEFTEKMEADEKIKNYLASRPESALGI